ncbi:unnamed protein product [Orchesella dallaii]|uniref:Uncharacterized protein n=1 Tax=Orchesella dallaii TaxID=48710 RepID=A0ABP1QAH0_9HEXA
MCGCYDVADFVCFLTFFITALAALLSVQYLVVFLDLFSTNAQGKPSSSYLLASLYFWVMTLLGCMVFAGIQRRSVPLLKWPGRLLVFLLISGLIAVTGFLWVVDHSHQQGVHDLEGKSMKLFVMLCVIISYFIAIHKLISTIQNPTLRGTRFVPTIAADDDNSDQITHPTVADFIQKRRKGRKSNKLNKSTNEISRPINVASDGVNYYVVLLESPYKSGESRFATSTKSRKMLYDAYDEEDSGSCSTITEV